MHHEIDAIKSKSSSTKTSSSNTLGAIVKGLYRIKGLSPSLFKIAIINAILLICFLIFIIVNVEITESNHD